MRRAALLLLAGLVLPSCEGTDEGWGPELERMIQQPRYDPYEESELFADARAMRTPPPGTVPRARPGAVAPAAGEWAFPPTEERLARGRNRYDIYCAVCHGLLGDGASPVAVNMQLRRPPSLHEPRLRALTTASLLHVITHGYGLMPGYALQLSEEERWGVAAYVRALQLSRTIPVGEVPASVREELQRAP